MISKFSHQAWALCSPAPAPALRPNLRPNSDDSLFHVIDGFEILGLTCIDRPNKIKQTLVGFSEE